MYEANFEFPYREPLQCDFGICQSELQADLIINAIISDKHFTFEQGIASDTWEINHNLNKFPSVTLVDTAGTQFQGRVEYIDENNCVVYMNGATKGKAYLN